MIRPYNTMILSDGDLVQYLNEQKIIVTPLEKEQIQPASIDIRLGDTFSIIDYEKTKIIKVGNKLEYNTFKTNSFTVMPGAFVLASTLEYVELPNNIAVIVEGRSSIGRIGLSIQNAPWVEPGFKGEITLELFNATRVPIELQAGTKIGQLLFIELDKNVVNPYCGKYQFQRGATVSKEY